MPQRANDKPHTLQFLIQADGAFFALAASDGSAPADSQVPPLLLEDGKGNERGVVNGSAGSGKWTGSAIYCGDSGLLSKALYYRLGTQPRQALAPLLRQAIAENKAWKSREHRHWTQHWLHQGTQLWQRALAYVRRGLFLLSSGQFALLTEKIRQRVSPSARRARAKANSASTAIPASSQRDELQTWFASQMGKHERLVLIVDHGLGGGATHYCRKLLASHLRNKDAVLLVTSDPLSGNYVLHLHTGDALDQRRIGDPWLLLRLPQWAQLALIVYNTSALFVHPLAPVALMLRLQQASGAKLKVLFHDYFPLCPSIFLIGSAGHYCGVPDQATCRKCLPANRSLPQEMRHYRHYDPIYWRQAWECLLAIAHESIAFSQASVKVLRQVWPQLDEARVQVIPHQADTLVAEPVCIRNTARLHIGVVGQIGPHKGIAVIAALAKTIKRRRLDVRISVIGSVEAEMDPAIVSQTGHYDQKDLPRLVAASGANVMLFPSVWPETFSYVVQELMALQLPLACFDMGAPAERVRSYDKGLILDSWDAATILEQLLGFHQRLYAGRTD